MHAQRNEREGALFKRKKGSNLPAGSCVEAHMRPHLTFFCIAAMAASPTLQAQTAVKITDANAIACDLMIGQLADAQTTLLAAGLDSATVEAVILAELQRGRPTALQSDSARAVNGGPAVNYSAYQLCEVGTEAGPMALVLIPSRENTHMPEGLRSNRDFHLLVHPEGLRAAAELVQKPKPSRGPRWEGKPSARIIRTDGVYATYDLAADPKALAVLERSGMSPQEIDAVLFRSHQRNWPEGIDEVHRRTERPAELQRLKAVEAARWDNKVLLIIPAELNRKIPEAVRPYLDIYMVYEADAVAVKTKK